MPVTETFVLPEIPVDLRLSRRGTNVTAYYRTTTSGGWVGVTNIGTSFTSTLYTGMTAFSGDRAYTATGVFDTVTFAYPQLETFDVNVANHAVTISSPGKPPMRSGRKMTCYPNRLLLI